MGRWALTLAPVLGLPKRDSAVVFLLSAAGLGAATGQQLEPGDWMQLGKVGGVRVLRMRLIPETDAADLDDGAELLPGTGGFAAGGDEPLAHVDDRLAVASLLRHSAHRRHLCDPVHAGVKQDQVNVAVAFAFELGDLGR